MKEDDAAQSIKSSLNTKTMKSNRININNISLLLGNIIIQNVILTQHVCINTYLHAEETTKIETRL